MAKTCFSIAEACAETTLSRPTIERLIAAGTLRSIKVGHRRLIPAEALAELLEHGAQKVA